MYNSESTRLRRRYDMDSFTANIIDFSFSATYREEVSLGQR